MKTRKKSHGFTLIETVSALAIISLLTVGLASLSNYVLNQSQTRTTNDNLNQLRRAISGNPVIVVNEARTSFGYVGDMGKLPTNIEDLWVKDNQPAFDFDTGKKAGAGWNGPYLELGAVEMAAAFTRDGWGNRLSYNRYQNPILRPVFGAKSLALLASLGPDLTLGNNDDIAINFFESEMISRIQGYVKDTAGNMVSGVRLNVNYPVDGVLYSQPIYSDATGYYSISNISYGNRSITMEPKLVLAPGTLTVSGTASQHLKFNIKNFDAVDHNVASLKLSYVISPQARFGEIKVGGASVYKYPSPNATRFGSPGTEPNSIVGTVNISPAKTVKKGPGVFLESIPIRLQSPITDVADLVVGKLGNGGALVIEFKDFFDDSVGGTNAATDVLGINFEVELKNSAGEIVGLIAVTP